ncbi:recombinase family protein [Pantoea sp. SJZ147]|uniref:recombinase family protein n=1 Tax=Pantoea sp. SJZ147 TaxID=2572896 RepID=UPI0011A355C9|nr:recombinase family protein [Pantoea sp. SJZ147]TWD33392.1 DNA invertase Pin-like site-specific DNA recombinase [Pantoea sp. SJZ147]
MPQLYSYVRWSSDKQSKGTTLERQMVSAKLFANENNLDLVEIIDPGVSAFKGKNAKEGKLGDFINAVEAGAIERDSWLYVENLDRLTRQSATEAQTLLIRLLNLGLTLVTGMDKRVYTLESVNKNPTELMISILLFSRANEESKTKSDRTTGNVLVLINRHREGLPVNIKSVGKHPWWIDDSGSQYEAVRKHEKYWPIAREIIDLYLSGKGAYKVKRHLDTKYPNGYEGKEWDYQMLMRMRKNKALYGERTLNINGKSFKLDNYYPSLCINEAEYLRLHELKRKNDFQSKDKNDVVNIKLLSGLSLLRCGKCGGTMSSFMNKGKPRYICLNGRHLQKNCHGWSVNALLIEYCVIATLVIGFINDKKESQIDNTENSNLLEHEQGELERIEKTISNVTYALEQGVNLDTMVLRLKELSTEREKLITNIDRIKQRIISLEDKGGINVAMEDLYTMISWSVISDTSNETRHKLRPVLDSLIEEVVVDKIDGCISMRIKLYNDDVTFIFTGEGRKPNWKFDVDFMIDGVPIEIF